jgi:hypothetical protein
MLPAARVAGWNFSSLGRISAMVVAAGVGGAALGFLSWSAWNVVLSHAIAGMVMIPCAVAAAVGRRPLQRNAETSIAWLRLPPLATAVLNGLALGFGATTRIAYWSFFSVIFVAAAAPDPSPRTAIAVGVAYGALRVAASLVLRVGLSLRAESMLAAGILARRADRVVAPATFAILAAFLLTKSFAN